MGGSGPREFHGFQTISWGTQRPKTYNREAGLVWLQFGGGLWVVLRRDKKHNAKAMFTLLTGIAIATLLRTRLYLPWTSKTVNSKPEILAPVSPEPLKPWRCLPGRLLAVGRPQHRRGGYRDGRQLATRGGFGVQGSGFGVQGLQGSGWFRFRV